MAKKQSRVPCTIHIPLEYPGGKEVEADKLGAFLDALDRNFGGSSVLGTIQGSWVSDTGQTIKEPMLRVEVSVLEEDIPQFERIAKEIGRHTRQDAMYVVVHRGSETLLLFGDDDGGPGIITAGGGA